MSAIAEVTAERLESQPALTSVVTGQAQAILEQARQEAAESGIPYAGRITPEDAWELVSSGAAELVDVRTLEELRFVGRVPGARHVAWQIGAALTKNPRFLRELENKVGKSGVAVLLCRSGKRSAAAAEAAAKAGFTNVFNILEGFEGDLDNQQRRGDSGGWRLRGLPWVQD